MFYHHSAWLDGLAECFGFHPFYLAARSNGGTLVGVLPLALVPAAVGRARLVSVPFSYGAGPVTAAALGSAAAIDDALCAAARAVARDHRARRVEIKRPNTDSPPAAGFERVQRYASYRVPTEGGEAQVWKRLHGASTQRGIRKSAKAGVQATPSDALADWQLMAALQSATSHRHGLPAPPARFFTGLCRTLQARGLADLYVARAAAGEPLGAIVVWKGRRDWIYAFGAAHQAQLELRPNHAMLWAALRDAVDVGAAFDLGRAAPEQTGLVQFKERWGGTPVALAYDYSPSAGGLNTAPRDRGAMVIANRVWSALPPSVARRGSFLYKYLG